VCAVRVPRGTGLLGDFGGWVRETGGSSPQGDAAIASCSFGMRLALFLNKQYARPAPSSH
jgi:hypothetical protein